jgi:hypothetical protein
VKPFIAWVGEYGVRRSSELDMDTVRTFRAEEATRLGKHGRKLRPHSVLDSHKALRTFFRWSNWLPRATYPLRYGVHGNSAFGLSRAVPWARQLAAEGAPALLAAIGHAVHRWYDRGWTLRARLGAVRIRPSLASTRRR